MASTDVSGRKGLERDRPTMRGRSSPFWEQLIEATLLRVPAVSGRMPKFPFSLTLAFCVEATAGTGLRRGPEDGPRKQEPVLLARRSRMSAGELVDKTDCPLEDGCVAGHALWTNSFAGGREAAEQALLSGGDCDEAFCVRPVKLAPANGCEWTEGQGEGPVR